VDQDVAKTLGELERKLLELERTLDLILVGERMQVAKAGQPDDALVHPRVVFHRAGAQWIKAGVDAEVARG